jgi:hypothetical protein
MFCNFLECINESLQSYRNIEEAPVTAENWVIVWKSQRDPRKIWDIQGRSRMILDD